MSNSQSSHDVDLFVIGGGSGGVRAARIAASHGARVMIAEESRWGGTCVVRGCVPKKLFVYASEVSAQIADAAGFGWHISGVKFDWSTLIANKDREIARLSGLYTELLGKAGVRTIEARARVLGPNLVEVDGRQITAGTILIAVGGRPRRPAIPGANEPSFITSDDAFHLKTLPRRITVMGGGYIGVEFAHIFSGLGCEVTLLHRGPLPLVGFDTDVRKTVLDGLKARRIRVISDAEPLEYIAEPTGGTLRITHGNVSNEEPLQSLELHTDLVLSAIGRNPHVVGLFDDGWSGVELGNRGAIVVDEHSRTSVPSIFAIGDVTARVSLTPVAIREGHAFADRQFGGAKPRVTDYDLVPTAVFSQPPAASVGLPESTAITNGHDVEVFHSVFRPMRNTLAQRDERTMMKLNIDRQSRKVLGVHMVGPDAPEIIQLAAVALTMGATKDDFDRTVAIHPTAAEEFVLMRG